MATRHAWLLAAAVLALGGIAVLTLVRPRLDGPLAPLEVERPQPDGAAGQALASASRPEAEHGEPAVAGAAAVRTAVAPELATGGPALAVLDARTRRPVPGAEVFAAEADSVVRARRGSGSPHWAFDLLRSARAARADERGIVRLALPPVPQALLVVGRAEGLLGARRLEASEVDGASLLLQPDHTLRVRVTGIRGDALAGVPVTLCADQGAELVPRATEPTRQDGIAELRHVQLFALPAVQLPRGQQELLGRALRQLDRRLRDGRGLDAERSARLRLLVERFRAESPGTKELALVERLAQPTSPGADPGPLADFVVLAAVPQIAPAQARVSPQAIPALPVELRLEALGGLAVRLVAADGSPMLSPCEVLVTPSGAPAPPASGLAQLCRLRQSKALGQELVQLEPVGLGLTLDVQVVFADQDWSFAEANVEGPRAPGEAREVLLRLPPRFALLTGRLIDPDGQPCAGQTTELLVHGALGRIEGEGLDTSAEGRFELPVELREPAPPYTLEVQARLGSQTAGCWLPLPALQPGLRFELGDVQLRGLRALAVGTVRDDQGQPVAGARVRLQSFRQGPRAAGAWCDDGTSTAETAADGSYRLLGEPRPLRLRLRAFAEGHAEAVSDELAFGGVVDLVLERQGAITGSGEIADWMPRRALRVHTASAGQTVRDDPLRAGDDGRFALRIAALRPGAYDVTIELRGVPQPLVAVRGIVVAAGGDTADPRLHDLSLARQAFRYVVRAVDGSGAAIADPGSPLLARLIGPDGRRHDQAFAWRDGRVELVATEPSVPVVALCAGHRPVHASLAPGETKITLERLQPIEVVLPGLRALVGPERGVRVSLVLAGDTGLPMQDLQGLEQASGGERYYPRAALGKSSGAWLGQDDRVQMPLMLNGRYEVWVRVSQPGTGGGPASRAVGSVDVVVDGPRMQSVTLTPAAGAVRDAVAELAGRGR